MPAPLALIEDAPATTQRVVALHGEIDVGSTPSLRDWLARASEGGRQSLAVDLSNVAFLAVSGLYVLCDEQARMARHRSRLTVICANRRFLQLFEVCRLDDVLRVVPDRGSLANGEWDDGDELRAARLGTWLRRYSSTVMADGAPAPSTPRAG
jgi:anti-anti-sigma factor